MKQHAADGETANSTQRADQAVIAMETEPNEHIEIGTLSGNLKVNKQAKKEKK